MTVADKYMSEGNGSSFKFIPPKFDKNLFRNGSFLRQEDVLNLFPSETIEEQMYCYYNQLTECKNEKNNMERCDKNEYEEGITVKIPTPSEILRMYNFEEENDMERNSEVNQIYESISKNNYNIIDSLTEYKIPVPIAKLITKNIVRLSVKYSEECNKL